MACAYIRAMASSEGTNSGVIARAARKHLAAQPGVLIHFKHVDAGMGNTGADEHVERLLPGGKRLTGQTCDQIHIEIGNSGGSQPPQDLPQQLPGCEDVHSTALRVSMKDWTPRLTRFTPAATSACKRVVGKLARRALDGDFGIRIEFELRPHRGEKASQQIRSQQTWRSAAQIHGVHAPWQIHTHLRGPLTSGCADPR